MSGAKRGKTVRTTVRLPRTLHEKVRQLVSKDGSDGDTMNDLFESAISTYVRLLERRKVDAAFARMATDDAYQKEARALGEEFSESDWEAFEAAEKETHR